MIPPAVLWVNPSPTTGLAALWGSGTSFWCDQLPWDEAASRIEWWCQRWQALLAVGWETYKIDVSLPQHQANAAIEMIGVARRYATVYRCLILPEGPRQTPKTPDRLLLEALGWWVPGKKEAQKAANHLLKWMIRSQNMTPAVAAVVSEAAGSL